MTVPALFDTEQERAARRLIQHRILSISGMVAN